MSRHFAGSLRRFVAVIIVAAVCSCSPASHGASLNANPWTQHGALRIAGRDVSNLNPLLASDNTPWELAHLWGGYLFNVDDRGHLVPELAREIPTIGNGDIARDGLAIRYKLRRGVKWQDGPPFTADDVIFTWKQVLNPSNNVASRSPYELVERIDRNGPYELTVHLRRPYAPFVAGFFVMDFCVLPEHLLADHHDLNHAAFNTAPVGTGPYRVTAFDRGSEIRFAANPGYWRGTPKLKSIVWRMVPDTNTAITELRSHDADLRTAIGPAQLDALTGAPGIKVYGAQQNARFLVIFNVTRPGLNDVRVRRALALATNVRDIVRDVTHNRYVASASDEPPFSWSHTDDVTHYDFNIAAAAALLDRAGWKMTSTGVREKNGRPLTFNVTSINSSPLANQVEVLLQNEWAAVGVQLRVKNYDVALLYGAGDAGGIYAKGQFDVALDATILGSDPDDSDYVLCGRRPPNGFNIGRYCDPQLDAAEHTATLNYDKTSRKRAYARAQQIVASDVPFIVLWYVKTLDAANSDLKGYRPAQGGVPYWNAWEWQI